MRRAHRALAAAITVWLEAAACSAPRAPVPAVASAGLSAPSTYSADMAAVPDDPHRYLTARIANARFVLAPNAYFEGETERHLVLKEVVDVEQSMAREPENGSITVQAFDALAGGDGVPRWTLRAQGIAGELFDFQLYKVTQVACCGASERALFFSLANGRFLFSSTVRPLSVEYAGTREKRYIGFDDGWGSTAPAEIAGYDDIIGVLEYGHNTAAIQRVAVIGDRHREFVADAVSIVINGKPVEGPDAVLFAYEKRSSFNNFAIALALVSRCNDAHASVLVPVVDDRLNIAGARLRGVALRELPAADEAVPVAPPQS